MIISGEANGAHPDEYYCLFPSMIDDWRQKFHDGSQNQTSRNFPFGFVQVLIKTFSNILATDNKLVF